MPKKRKAKLTDKLRVFLSPADMKLVREAAAKERKTVSQFVREALLRAIGVIQNGNGGPKSEPYVNHEQTVPVMLAAYRSARSSNR